MSKILIVEDEVAIADLEKDYLELSDFQVDICNTGDEGLAMALNGEYNLVILDLMLPGMDGFEVCRKIREEKNIPILMVSAKKDDIDNLEDKTPGQKPKRRCIRRSKSSNCKNSDKSARRVDIPMNSESNNDHMDLAMEQDEPGHAKPSSEQKSDHNDPEG